MYDLKPSQFVFIEWDRSRYLFAFNRFDICIDKNHVMICNARVYFYVIYKGTV